MASPSQPHPQRLSVPYSDRIDACCSTFNNHPHMTRSVSSPLLLRFNPHVRVRYVPSLDDLTSQERLNTWYSSEDYEYIRRREHGLMRELSRHVHFPQQNDQNHCRGRVSLTQRVLGLQTNRERDDRRQRIREAQFSVLYEQARYGDPDRLARIYFQISKESTQQARDRGYIVEIVVRNLDMCLDSTRRGGSTACVDSPPSSGNSSMRYRRWSADPSSSQS
jgi:hypothetical protein